MFARGLLLPILLLAFWPAPCVAGVAPVIPEQLKPWTEWVLFDYEEQQRCTPSYADASSLQCDWPSELTLTVTAALGHFSQQWLVQHERWLQLPGNLDHWPQEVKIDNRPALVISRKGRPGSGSTRGDIRSPAVLPGPVSLNCCPFPPIPGLSGRR